MKALYITLCIIGYILVGALTAWIDYRFFDERDKTEAIACGFIWPLSIVFLLGGSAAGLVLMFIDWLGEKWDEAERKKNK